MLARPSDLRSDQQEIGLTQDRGRSVAASDEKSRGPCQRQTAVEHRPLVRDSQSEFGFVWHHRRNASTLSNAIGKAFKANCTESPVPKSEMRRDMNHRKIPVFISQLLP
jgi:hypothetical protein